MDDEQIKVLEKFTDFVRHEIKENKIDLVATKRDLEKYAHRDVESKLPEDHKYGLVEIEVFQKVLNKYEEMQKDRSTMESAVKCDKLAGNTLSSYLHAKLGFHNFGSTTLLMKELRIKDPNRYSFLGGIANLEPPSEERLSILKQMARRAEVDKYLLRAKQLLHMGQPKDVKALIEKCTKIDPNNPEIYAIHGSLQLVEGKITEAISTLRAAFDRPGIRDRDKIRKDLSQAYSNQGHKMMAREIWRDAIYNYEEAIRWDQSNETAAHQLNYCRSKFQFSQTCGWGRQMQNYERRK